MVWTDDLERYAALPRRQRILLARSDVEAAIGYLAAELPERELSPERRAIWDQILTTLQEAHQGLEQLCADVLAELWSEDD